MEIRVSHVLPVIMLPLEMQVVRKRQQGDIHLPVKVQQLDVRQERGQTLLVLCQAVPAETVQLAGTQHPRV